MSNPFGVDSQEMRCLALYLTDLTILDATFLRFRPSVIAAAAIILTRKLSRRLSASPRDKARLGRTRHRESLWPRRMQELTHTSASSAVLRDCVHALRVLHNEAWAEYLAPIRRQVDRSSLKHFRELYQFRIYSAVSTIAPLDDTAEILGRALA